MGGHSRRRNTSGALPGAGLPSRGTMVHVKFPAPSKIQHHLQRQVILGRISKEQADERLSSARSIIRTTQERIWRTVDAAGGARARREDGEVVGDVPMGTFALPEQNADVAKVIHGEAAAAQRRLAGIGVGGIQFTAPARYVSAGRPGHQARKLSPESSALIGRRVGMWRKDLAMLSIDIPADHPQRRTFYRVVDKICSAEGSAVRRFGHSAYVGSPGDVLLLQKVATDLNIDYRA